MIKKVAKKTAGVTVALLMAAGIFSGCSDAFDVVTDGASFDATKENYSDAVTEEISGERAAFATKGDRIYVVAETKPTDRMQFRLDLGNKTLSAGSEITFYTAYNENDVFPAETELVVRDGTGSYTKWTTKAGPYGKDTGNSSTEGWYPITVTVPSSYSGSTNKLGFTFTGKNFEKGSVIAVKFINIAPSFDASAWSKFSTDTTLRFSKTEPSEWHWGNNVSSVKRRAVAFANVDNSAINELDITSFEKAFKSQTLNGEKMAHVERVKNSTLSQIKQKIKNVFADTDDDDVSYIVISCHGSSDGGIYIGTDDRFTGKTLRNTLDQYVKGEVVLFIDCCYAGQAIGRSAANADAEACMNKFISDFFNLSARSGELASKRFHVLCAVDMNHLSHGGTIGVGINAWEKGLGWDALGDRQIALNADANGDKKVTLAELHAYSAPLTAYTQRQVVYPDNDNFVIGGRY